LTRDQTEFVTEIETDGRYINDLRKVR
jgi:hypothetical protein